jgi:Tol biopolymer transport system component
MTRWGIEGMGMKQWAKAPLAGVLALALLLSAVKLGARLPGFDLLDPFGNGANIDYSALPLREPFNALREQFVAEVLGGAPYQVAANPGRAGDVTHGDEVLPADVISHSATNGDIDHAYPITHLPTSTRTNTADAAPRGVDEPDDCSLVGDSVWYRYDSPRNQGLLASTDGTDRPVALGVYRGSPDDLDIVGCDSDARGSAHVSFNATADTSYFFQVTSTLRAGPVAFTLQQQPVTSLLSLNSRGRQSDGRSQRPYLSASGRFLVFSSDAENLDRRHPFGQQEYIRDLATGQTELVSLASDGAVKKSCSWCFGEGEPQVSADGRYVVFSSWASNLVPDDTNGTLDVFVRDRKNATTERVSVTTGGEQANSSSFHANISAGGRFVAFWSFASNLDPRVPHGTFWHDRVTGETRLVSVSSAGEPANDEAIAPNISPDGRYVSFFSGATNLTADGPGLQGEAAYAYNSTRKRLPALPDLSGRTGVGTNARDAWWFASGHIYVHDVLTHRTIDACTNSAGQPADAGCGGGSLSLRGRFVAFYSSATNLVPPGTIGPELVGLTQVYTKDLTTGAVELVSMSSTGQAGGDVGSASPGAYPVTRDTPVRDPRRNTSDTNRFVSISWDGRFVSFDSEAHELAPGDDANTAQDIYVRDRTARRTIRASVSTGGHEANEPSYGPQMSADGRMVVFTSGADDLVADDGNFALDIFLRV